MKLVQLLVAASVACAAGETPAPATASRTLAPATAATTMLSAIRGGNDQEEDAAEAATPDDSSSDWQRLAREERVLVKQLAERQTALEIQQAAIVKHQQDLGRLNAQQTALEKLHNTDVLTRVSDLKTQHTSLERTVQRVAALKVQLTGDKQTHTAVLRQMQVPESVIEKMHADPATTTPATNTTCGAVPVPGNGYKLSYTTDEVGGTVKFACQRGYFLIGSEERVCLRNFRWSGATTFCEPFSKAPTPAPTPLATTAPVTPAPTPSLCPNFEVPQHAQFSLTERTTGGKVHFNCNPPYLLIGPPTATCMASGQWTVFPACIGKITQCSHLKCKLRVRQTSAYSTQRAVAVYYDKQEKMGTRHHCQFKHDSQDVDDCKCWCWFDSDLERQEEAERRATEEQHGYRWELKRKQGRAAE